jgi:predicted flap endonuclease-1-like 5' DNA nuclease
MSSLPPPRELEEIDDGWGAGSGDDRITLPAPRAPDLSDGLSSGKRDSTVVQLEQKLTEQTRTLNETRQRLEAMRQRLAAAEDQIRTLEARNASVQMDLDAAQDAQRRLQQQLDAARAGAASTDGDDLQAIRGIGPKLSTKLRAAGISRYADLAALDAEGVTKLADRLGIRRGRIERDGWVEAARRLSSRS